MFMGLIPGGFCQIQTFDRSYCINYIIDESIDRFFVDVYPQIICEKPYMHMMHAYVNAKTSGYKAGRIDIDHTTGEVKVRVESSIADKSASVADIKAMESLAILICISHEKRLDKMAHGVYFDEDDPELMSAAERLLNSLEKRRALHRDAIDESDDSIDELLKLEDSDEDDGHDNDDAQSDDKTT